MISSLTNNHQSNILNFSDTDEDSGKSKILTTFTEKLVLVKNPERVSPQEKAKKNWGSIANLVLKKDIKELRKCL